MAATKAKMTKMTKKAKMTKMTKTAKMTTRLPYGGGLTGYSDESEHDEKMTDENEDSMTITNEVHGSLIPGDILPGEHCRGPV